MDGNEQSLSISLAGTAFDWVTATHLALVALFAIGAVAILIWGRHLRRQRRRAEEQAGENNEVGKGEDGPPGP